MLNSSIIIFLFIFNIFIYVKYLLKTLFLRYFSHFVEFLPLNFLHQIINFSFHDKTHSTTLKIGSKNRFPGKCIKFSPKSTKAIKHFQFFKRYDLKNINQLVRNHAPELTFLIDSL